MPYNKGNYEKHNSKNPLKRYLAKRLNERMLNIIQMLQDEMGTKRLHILDAGCGEGFIVDLISGSIANAVITGLDYSEEALNYAKQKNAGIHFVQSDICKMPFSDHSFDIVLCSEVLEHLSDPTRALMELRRVAKNALILTVPHEPWFRIGNLLVLKNVCRFGNPIDHINHWTYRGFRKFAENKIEGDIDFASSFPWTIAVCRFDRK